MTNIYIIGSNHYTYFSRFLNTFEKTKYIHISIATDDNLSELYSFGRKNPKIIFPAGFVTENLEDLAKVFDKSEIIVYKLSVTKNEFKRLNNILENDFLKYQDKFRYNIKGLPLMKLNKEYQREFHYVCSSFCGKLLSDSGIIKFDKDLSLIKPIDILSIGGLEKVYEGKTSDYFTLTKKSA